jgi:hypothetical protein
MGMIGIGFIICLASTGRGVPGVMYFGIFVAVVGKHIPVTNFRVLIYTRLTQIPKGIYPAFPGNVTWLSVNMAGDYKRAAGMAIYIGLGNLAGGKDITSIGSLRFKLMLFSRQLCPQTSTELKMHRITSLDTPLNLPLLSWA